MAKTSRNAPLTSYLAAARVKDGSQRSTLIRELHRRPVNGLTSHEASTLLGTTPNQAAARMLELREVGIVTRNGRTRPTSPGNFGMVHVLSPLQNA